MGMVIVVASFSPSPVVGGGIMRAPAASHPTTGRALPPISNPLASIHSDQPPID